MALKAALSTLPNTAVVDYKSLLANILSNRPSGTRQRLANRLNKSKSFISLITNPAHETPIPAADVAPILETCHATPEERTLFLACYMKAHPKYFVVDAGGPKLLAHTIYLPDLGDAQKNQNALKLINSFTNDLIKLMSEKRD
jgi:hypothetical protein